MARKTTPTLADAAEDYIRLRKVNCKTATWTNDASVVGAFVRGVGATTQVHKLSPQKAESYMASERARMKASSFNKSRSRVNRFLNHCRVRGWLDGDPMGLITTARETKTERFRLSARDLMDLPNHTDNARDRAFIAMAANSALRSSELTRMKVKDVDFGTASFRASIEKSAMEDVMPMSSELDTELRQWLRAYEEDAGTLDPEWFLFPAREPAKGRRRADNGQMVGGHLMHSVGHYVPEKAMGRTSEVVKAAMVGQGHHVEVGEGVHTIRRSVARIFFDMRVRGGYDCALRETSSILHHGSSIVTERYLGLSSERLGRDKALRGKSFLGAAAAAEADADADVQPLRVAAGGQW